jgi:pimeloyl-ACP methyl ester carboxylesterase
MSATSAERKVSRLDVRSADGTRLAVWVEGQGPPLVLVHGSLQDHTASGGFVEELRRAATTYSVDRRGFGASDDAPGYAIEREFEDVASVVDDVAARAGSPVAVWGHSYGANCAMGGAARTDNVGRLVLYEPSLGVTFPAGAIDSIERKVAAGDLEAALLELLVDIAGMTEGELDAMRTSPYMLWAARVATVPTLPRECRAEEGWVYGPGQFDGVAAPTLMLRGSESPAVMTEATEKAAAAIANARTQVLPGHGHFAHRTDPAMVARIVRRFLDS